MVVACHVSEFKRRWNGLTYKVVSLWLTFVILIGEYTSCIEYDEIAHEAPPCAWTLNKETRSCRLEMINWFSTRYVHECGKEKCQFWGTFKFKTFNTFPHMCVSQRWQVCAETCSITWMFLIDKYEALLYSDGFIKFGLWTRSISLFICVISDSRK